VNLSSIKVEPITAITEKLKHVTPGFIEGPFIFGLLLTGILLTSLILALLHALLYAHEREQSILTYQLYRMELKTVLHIVAGLNLISFIYLPSAISTLIYIVDIPNVNIEKGTLLTSSLIITSCAIAMNFCMFGIYLELHASQK
jgi:hypothetical protein